MLDHGPRTIDQRQKTQDENVRRVKRAGLVPRFLVYGLWSMVLCLVCSPLSFANLQLTTDQRQLFFGVMQVGESKELAQSGTYHNQITCSSTNGRMWYVKVNVLQPLSSGGRNIPLENFQWQVSASGGAGSIAHPHEWRPFSLMPDTVYISSPTEQAGATVQLQFKYSLQIPDSQVAGIYQTTIRFTLTEAL